MRDARFVGLAANGDELIIEHEGEHLRLPLDGRVRAALAGDPQIPMPLEAHVTPREVQHRIRCGESAADIAASSGVAVDRIARFEGPVLDERRWHAEQARRAVIDGTPLAERLAAVAPRAAGAEDDTVWDARLGDDGGWRVIAVLADGCTAEWGWDPRTHRLRGRDDLARLAASGDVARDDLEAVLRPIAAARRAQRFTLGSQTVTMPAADQVDGTGDVSETDANARQDWPSDQAGAEPEPAAEPVDAQTEPLPTRTARRRRRAHVPSWDEIVGASPRRSPMEAD